MSDDEAGGFRGTCDELSVFCPVEATVLGYAPNLGANIFFTVAFGVSCLATLAIGFRAKTWTFSGAVALACILETMGESPSSSEELAPFARGARASTPRPSVKERF